MTHYFHFESFIDCQMGQLFIVTAASRVTFEGVALSVPACLAENSVSFETAILKLAFMRRIALLEFVQSHYMIQIIT